MKKTVLFAAALLVIFQCCAQVAGPSQRSFDISDPSKLHFPSVNAPGYPSNDAGVDLREGFLKPPDGYGEVPFWWWSGDALDKDRLLWQIEELHRKGINGMQVNYIHRDSPGWPTYPAEPAIFSPEWWDIWKFAASEAGKRDMGIGISGYTLDWPKSQNLFTDLIYSDRDINGTVLGVDTVIDVAREQKISLRIPANTLEVWSYEFPEKKLKPGGKSLKPYVSGNMLEWTATAESQVWIYTTTKIPGTLNPVHPLAGKTVVEKFFQPFEDNAANRSAEGLNYFFQDELKFGVGDYVWTDDMRDEFVVRKGYDMFEILPGLFAEHGTLSVKARLDYMDVKVALSEERYFKPIFDWHWSRGKIYGCDPEGRGLSPGEYGDNFRVQRWYTAPGHDTPGGRADLIKGKVSSSIAALYKRPRVWIEGYHSLGWGAAPELLMYATSENYLYGCNLLNLHGLYYTTHGSYWEWAPPCYHFRMPYWEHMPVFLQYFERLSYLLSHGVLQAETAILYPVSTAQAGVGEKLSASIAFDAGRKLFNSGYDFLYVDDQSLARAEIHEGRLRMADQSFRVLVLPAIEAIRWPVLLKAYEFFRSGGIVIAAGALPSASDNSTAKDPELDRIVTEMFGTGLPSVSKHASGGSGIFVSDAAGIHGRISQLYLPYASSAQGRIRYMYRKTGDLDVFMVMGAAKNSEVLFKAQGIPEQWDPWTGRIFPVEHRQASEGTFVRMPHDTAAAQIIVFSSSETAAPGGKNPYYVNRVSEELSLDGDWEFELKPVMDNRWGDFRLPVTEQIIGAEARRFRYSGPQARSGDFAQPDFDDSAWETVTYGFGQKFWKLGPLPDDTDKDSLEKMLLKLNKIDPEVPVIVSGRSYAWKPYNFSWRMGVEGDPGHQGYHGLKEEITDEFICLGRPQNGLNEILYKSDPAGSLCYLWSTVPAEIVTNVTIDAGGLEPDALYVNGKLESLSGKIALMKGSNPVLIRYTSSGRGHFVVLEENATVPAERTPLSMKWYDTRGRMSFDANPVNSSAWYRFTAPPGLKGMFIRTNGLIKVYVDGREAVTKKEDGGISVALKTPIPGKSVVAMKVLQLPGEEGGSAFPESVLLNCGKGLAPAGDWSEGSVLENYSGGAWYRKSVNLTRAQSAQRVFLDLGDVVATAEIHVNGKLAGTLVTGPWKLEISEYVREGVNELEILVFNTLANHYSTIPTKYRGKSLKSGLLGPVRLEFGN